MKKFVWVFIFLSVSVIAQEVSLELPPTPAQIDASQSVTEAPAWLEGLMLSAESVPFVGPALVEVLKWLGVIGALMTALVTFILSVTRTLFFAARWTRLGSLMLVVANFEKGKVMYWLKYFSLYNAKKYGES